jgi:hypothetical protein
MANGQPPRDLKDALSKLIIGSDSFDPREKTYAFWGTQPVAQFTEDDSAEVSSRSQPPKLAGNGLLWAEISFETAFRLPTATQQPPSAPAPQATDGPIDAPKTVEDVRKEPYALPPRWALTYKWIIFAFY